MYIYITCRAHTTSAYLSSDPSPLRLYDPWKDKPKCDVLVYISLQSDPVGDRIWNDAYVSIRPLERSIRQHTSAYVRPSQRQTQTQTCTYAYRKHRHRHTTAKTNSRAFLLLWCYVMCCYICVSHTAAALPLLTRWTQRRDNHPAGSKPEQHQNNQRLSLSPSLSHPHSPSPSLFRLRTWITTKIISNSLISLFLTPQNMKNTKIISDAVMF